ncbi:polysaccharide deacetylase family protein [Arthrobacter koreensis]|uniref:Polysaccharide deacetylase family protein n=1 Tax=Arthrobacter koreensis TaxID=199136 RepID=A0ABY6FQL8_9MICC|nr:polysaccharide deacetylase family protein [Arthrobacter koreensis]UYB35515.1 polysaccharide deacetylase family protein [Arthrobacter koreensis]
MPYPFDQIFAADPDNTEMVASNTGVLIFAPGDPTRAPLTLTTLTGIPLANPVPVNDKGFGPAFIADLDQVAWEGGGHTGLFASYKGIKDEAVAARQAAEDVRTEVQAPTDEAVDRGITRANIPNMVASGVRSEIEPLLAPTVQQIAAEYVGSNPAIVDAAAAAVNANPKINELSTTTVRLRGKLADGTDLNTVRGASWAGLWEVSGTTSVNSMVNAPDTKGFSYSLQVNTLSNGVTSQTIISYASGFGCWVRATNNTAGTSWVSWDRLAATREIKVWDGGNLPQGTNLNALPAGAFQVNTGSDAATMQNLPPGAGPGNGETFKSSNGLISQFYMEYGSREAVWYRSTGSLSNGTMQPWRNITESTMPEIVGMYQRETLVDAFRQRRGGVIGTDGLPAVSLIFDHGLVKFRDIVLPLLRKYGLPWAQVLNSRTLNTAANGGVTLSTVQDWAIADGGEIWNHGATHNDATTKMGLFDEIVNGLEELKAGIPKLPIEGFAPPGLPDGEYMGASGFNTPAKFYGTYAGRLMMAYHAAVRGYAGNTYRSLPQDLPIGGRHVTMDQAARSTMINILNAITEYSTPVGCQIMLHPSYVGDAGYVSAADVEAVFADIAARRDAGRLKVVTPTAMLLADHRTTHRHELLKNVDFSAGLNGWNGTGWTVGAEGGTGVATSGGEPLTQGCSLYRRDMLKGATRELKAVVRIPSGGSVRLAIPELGVDRIVAVQSGSGWVRVSKCFTIPLNVGDGSFTVSITKLTGSSLEVREVKLQSV